MYLNIWAFDKCKHLHLLGGCVAQQSNSKSQHTVVHIRQNFISLTSNGRQAIPNQVGGFVP